MSSFINKMISSDKVRYLIAGGCTTLVNFIAFFALRNFTTIQRNICNVIAILLAIAFAYFINKFFVFKSKNDTVWKNISEIISFLGARIIAMLIEVLGFAILCDSFRIGELWSKILVQFVVVILNYVFSKLFVFNKERRSFRQFLADTYIYIIPFVVIMIVMIAVCISNKVMPFGNKTLTLIDSLHQYVPFYGEYRDKLLNEGSLFYTWNLALGSNFVSLFAYYLSSPFNYLFILFPKMSIPSVITAIVILKLSLTGSTMAYFLANNGKFGKKSIPIIAISICYAFSNFMIGYGWNFMWLDCLMILPLIILGFSKLMEEKKPNMYVLSLFYCLYCNYYIGFIVCIFLVLWFLVYSHRSIKEFFTNGVFFAFYSIIAAGIAGFLLIPAYKGIMMTASAGTEFPKKWNWYGSIYEMFKQQFILTEPLKCQTFDGGLNAYCGTFAIFAVFLYLTCGKIRLRERIGKVLLLAFLMVSFNSETLNFIWHGFHNQYGIPNRFSFVYIFVLLYMAAEVLKRMDKLNSLWVSIAGVMSMGFVMLCKKYAKDMSVTTIKTTVILLIVYLIILVLASSRVVKRRILAVIFTVVCSGELIYNAAWGYDKNGVASFSYYDTTAAVAKANEYIDDRAKTENAGFYRSELMKSKILDEVTWHNMPSVGTFCSTVLGESTTTMGRLGFYTGANEFLYMGSTPFTNTLLNVRYLIKRNGDLDNYAYDYLNNIDGTIVYENPYPSAIGYAVSNEVKKWNRDAGMPIIVQNMLIENMTGEKAIFEECYPEIMVSSEKCDTEINNKYITYTPKSSGSVDFSASFIADGANDYYIHCKGNNIYKLRIYVNGSELGYDRYQGQIFHVGKLEVGDYVSVDYTYNSATAGSSGTASMYVYTFDEAKYQKAYQKLVRNLMSVDEYDDGYIHGKINVPEGETLFTTIPFDEGWKVKVDGKAVGYYKTAGAFIGVDMTPGEHEIEFKYTPSGLYAGIAISLYSLLLFVLVGQMGGKKKKRKKKTVKVDIAIDQELNI